MPYLFRDVTSKIPVRYFLLRMHIPQSTSRSRRDRYVGAVVLLVSSDSLATSPRSIAIDMRLVKRCCLLCTVSQGECAAASTATGGCKSQSHWENNGVT